MKYLYCIHSTVHILYTGTVCYKAACIYNFYFFYKRKENISDLKSCVVHRADPTDPSTEDDGEVVDVREGGEVSVGGENFILRHAEAWPRVFMFITSLSSLVCLRHCETPPGYQCPVWTPKHNWPWQTSTQHPLPPSVSLSLSLSRIYSLIISKSLLSLLLPALSHFCKNVDLKTIISHSLSSLQSSMAIVHSVHTGGSLL